MVVSYCSGISDCFLSITKDNLIYVKKRGLKTIEIKISYWKLSYSYVEMIGSNFLSSSTWSSELSSSKDYLPSLDTFVVDIELGNMTFDSSENWEDRSCSYPGTPDHSSSSEECDWNTFDSNCNNLLPISVSQLLDEEESVIDSLDLNDLDWLSLSNNFQSESCTTDSVSEIPSNTTDPPMKKKQTKSPEHISSASKSWSKMTRKEKLRTAHVLSEIISRQMGFREQIEVIKLIDPSAELTSSDTEFALELSYLNDVKLKRICKYLRKHTVSVTGLGSLLSSKTSSTSSSNKAKRKQKEKVQRKYIASAYVNESELREKKFIRQGKREKRSGLFVKEKVIKKLSNPQEEDEDVNILE